MYPAPEQLTSLNRTNIDAAMRFAGVALQGAQRLIDLQIEQCPQILIQHLWGLVGQIEDHVYVQSLEHSTCCFEPVTDG